MAKKTGRKSKYDSGLLKVAVKHMAERGFTDAEMSEELNISRSTLSKWKKDNPGFAEELKDWKITADSEVEKSLYQRACGYEHPETKAQWITGTEIIDGVVVTAGRWETLEMVKHYPPDPTSMIFWLKNRKPDEWRDTKEVDAGDNIMSILAKVAEKRG